MRWIEGLCCVRVDESSHFLHHALVPYIGARWRSSIRLSARVPSFGASHRGVTARKARKAASTTEFDAALFLDERSKELRHKRRAEKTVADQLVQTATVRPRKYRARYLRAQVHVPSARKDAEDSERNCWTRELADLVRGIRSPMGQFLASQPGNQLTGGARRASTLRSRVSGVKRFLSCLALRYELTYPTALNQLTEHLQVRLQEPCNRGSQHSMVFLESMAGVSPQERFTDSQLYNVLYQELLVAALPGSPANTGAQSPHRHARRTGTPGRRVRSDASRPSGLRLVALDPEMGHAQVLRSQGHPAKQCEDRRDGFLSSSHQVKDPERTAQSPLDRSSSTTVALWPSPDGCKKGGVCLKTWQTTLGTTLFLFRLPTGTGAEDESCRTTQLQPC